MEITQWDSWEGSWGLKKHFNEYEVLRSEVILFMDAASMGNAAMQMEMHNAVFSKCLFPTRDLLIQFKL